MKQPMKILSLGAGVQSSTLALMSKHGEIEKMDCAIFADTGAEPQAVYDWLDWLENQLPFPVHRVIKNEGLKVNIIESLKGGRFAGAPFFTESSNGGGMLRRQCSREFKVEPITKKLRELVGLKPRQRAPKGKILAYQYIGISFDEIQRMKDSRDKWSKHIHPLIEMRMRRIDCLRWMQEHGYPEPPRSACSFCPYHSNHEWRHIKANQPDAWAEANEIDKLIRDGVRGTTERLYLHRSLQPLDKIDFRSLEDKGQINMFNNECEGICGV